MTRPSCCICRCTREEWQREEDLIRQEPTLRASIQYQFSTSRPSTGRKRRRPEEVQAPQAPPANARKEPMTLSELQAPLRFPPSKMSTSTREFRSDFNSMLNRDSSSIHHQVPVTTQPQQTHARNSKGRIRSRNNTQISYVHHKNSPTLHQAFLRLLWCTFALLLSCSFQTIGAQTVAASPQQCKLFMAVADTNRDSSLSTAEYVTWLTRVTANQFTAYDALPESLKTLYTTHATAANGQVDISGARPGTATTAPTQGSNLDAMCAGVQAALAAASTGGTVAPGTTTPAIATLATATPATATPATPTPATAAPAGGTNVRLCTINMAVTDGDRNNLLSETEYIAFLNRLTTNKYASITTFASLPQALQDNYNTLMTQSGAAPGTGLSIIGASPATTAGADAAQLAFLEQICASTDAAVAAASGTATVPGTTSPSTITPETVGPSTITPGSVGPSTIAPGTDGPSTTTTPGTITPGTVGPSAITPSTIAPGATMAPTTPFNVCSIHMAVSDTDRNSLMSSTEYVAFVNRLAANQWATATTLEALPQPLQDAFNSMAAGNEIDIYGASPGQIATEAQTLTLQSICATVDQAIYTANNPGGASTVTPSIGGTPLTPGTGGPSTITPSTIGPGTMGPSTLTPGTTGPSTITPGMGGPSTVGPGTTTPGTVGPSTLTPGTAGPGTVGPSTTTPGSVGPTTPAPTEQDTTLCKIRMAGADRSLDGMLSFDEYVIFINFLDGNQQYQGVNFTALPMPLQENFNDLADATTGQIPITGASPAQSITATPEQVTNLDNICIKTSAAIQDAESTTVPPTTINPGITAGPSSGGGNTSTTPMPSTNAPVDATSPTMDPASPIVTVYSSFLLSGNQTAQEMNSAIQFNRLPIEDAYLQFVQTVTPGFLASLNGETLPPSGSNTSTPSTGNATGMAPPDTATPSAGSSSTVTPGISTVPVTPDGTVPPGTATPSTANPLPTFNATMVTTMGPSTLMPNGTTSPPDAPTLPASTGSPGATSPPTSPASTSGSTVLLPNGTGTTLMPGTSAATTQLPTSPQTTLVPATSTDSTQLPTSLQSTLVPGTSAAATQLPTIPQTAVVPQTAAPARRMLRGYWRQLQEVGTIAPGTVTPSISVPVTTTAVPGTASPGTIPASATPATGVPSSSVQGTALPGSAAPGSVVPSTVTPATVVPGATAVPGSVAPGTALPGATAVPGTAAPGTAIPGTTVNPATGSPGTALPGTSTPGSTVPGDGTALPSTVFPGTDPSTVTPGTTGPSTGLPGTVTPGTAVPETTNSPGTTTPSTVAPGTVGPSSGAPGTALPTLGTTGPSTATPGTVGPSAVQPPSGESIVLNQGSPRVLRFEDSPCPAGATAPNCLIAFAQYSVTVPDGVDKTAVYDTLVAQTQEAIRTGELQTALSAVDPTSSLTILGPSEPVYMATPGPTTPPATPTPTEKPEDDSTEAQKTYLGLPLAGFLGIVLVLVCVTCVACGCFGYVFYNLKNGGGGSTKQDGPTKEISASNNADDPFDDEEQHKVDSVANVESVGGFQIDSNEGNGFFSNYSVDSDDDEEKPSDKTEGNDEDAEFGIEFGGPDLPDQFKVDIEEEYSSEEETDEGDIDGFANAAVAGKQADSEDESESEDNNDFGSGFKSSEKDANGFFTSETNDGFFGGGDDDEWGQPKAPEPPAPSESFGFESDDASSLYSEGEDGGGAEDQDEESAFDDASDDDYESEEEEDEGSESEEESVDEETEAIREQIVDLVRDAAPHELDNIDLMMEQFAGREEELLQTLKTMHGAKGSQDDEESYESDEESEGEDEDDSRVESRSGQESEFDEESQFDEGSQFDDGSQYEEESQAESYYDDEDDGDRSSQGYSDESSFSGDDYSEDQGDRGQNRNKKGNDADEDSSYSDSDYS